MFTKPSDHQASGPRLALPRPLWLLLPALLAAAPAAADPLFLNAPADPLAGYHESPRAASTAAQGPNGLSLLYGFYQRFIGGNRGYACPMEPSCSEYSRRALAQHGIVRGLALTADRLLRCGSDLHLYPVTLTSRGLSHVDPVPE